MKIIADKPTRWDYTFIGAGPATLVAATLLSKTRDCRILILEAGGPLARRGCPGLRRTTCTKCSDADCRVTMGVGGSSAGFGNKLCHFPASSGVLSLIPSDLMPYVQQVMAEHIGHEARVQNRVATISSSAIRRKFYSADALFRSQYHSLLQGLLSDLSEHVELRCDAPVQEVRKHSEGFELQLDAGDAVLTSNLILGTGRAGHRFIKETLTALGVACRENHSDIGIRLEASNDLFSNTFFYQNDPKFKFDHGELGSSRTFCACRGGRIVPVKFGSGFFADGAFVNAPTGVTNVALMVRSNVTLTSDEIDEWCEAINVRAGRSLLLGELSRPSPTEILDRVPVWPSQVHKSLMSELLDNIVGGKYVQMFDPHASEQVVRVYGPAVDLYWPSPVLSPGFRTEIDSLSVIGDAAGVSRGIVQALASGIAWALVEAAGIGLYDTRSLTQPDSSAAA